MSSNIRAFDLALNGYAEEVVPEQAARFHRAVTLEAARGVILMTPVDSGRARANWQVTMAEPATGEADATDPSGGDTLAKATAAVERIQPYSVSWVSNNVTYIEELEVGTSKQAPQGMMAVTLARIQQAFG